MARPAVINPPRQIAAFARGWSIFETPIKKPIPIILTGRCRLLVSADAKLLIVGLAPGLHGANRTARPFYRRSCGRSALCGRCQNSASPMAITRPTPMMAWTLNDAMIYQRGALPAAAKTNRSGAEIRTCRKFLIRQLDAFSDLRVILCLGRIAHESTPRHPGQSVKKTRLLSMERGMNWPIRHFCPVSTAIIARATTRNTRRLTSAMFEDVFGDIRRYIDAS